MANKILPFDVALKEINPIRSFDCPKAYTNDLNSVEFQFTLTDMSEAELVGATANVVLYMRDKSFFQNTPATGVTLDGNVVKYVMKENEGNHAGKAQVQVEIVYTDPAKVLSSKKYDFEIINGLEMEVAVEVIIQDWSTLVADATEYIEAANAAEAIRLQSEIDRVAAENIRLANDTDRPIYHYVTQAEYDALTIEEQNDPKHIYEVTDSDGEVLDELTGFITGMQTQFDNAISGTTVDSETINARVDKSNVVHQTLKKRLDNDKSITEQSLFSLSNQLEQSVDEQRKLKVTEKTTKNLFITLMDDDAKVETFTVLKPLLDEFGFKCSFAINVGLVGNSGYLTWSQIEQLKAEGHEILNHTVGTNGTQISSKTEEQLLIDYTFEKSEFIAHGLSNYDYLVYSGILAIDDLTTRNKINSVYKCCFANTTAPNNYLPFDNYYIRRGSLIYKAIEDIDELISRGNDGYLVLFGHAWEYTPERVTYLRSVFTKLQTSGLTFATAKEMVDNYSNVINLGNSGNDRFMLDKNGNVDFTYKGDSVQELFNTYFPVGGFRSAVDANPITIYRRNCVTIEKLGGTYANHGLPQSGVIKTYRFKNDPTDTYAYQEYSSYTTGDIYKRMWSNSKGDWSTPFAPYNPIVVTSNLNKPAFMRRGYSLFDNMLSKPLWARFDMFGYVNTSVQRLTTYNLGDYVRRIEGNNLYKCIVSGTTSDTLESWSTTTGAIIVDGTAQFQCLGYRASFIDSSGAVVFWD